MPSIAGQSILVIGGSSGIGAAVARLAFEQGVRVSIASSNASRVAAAVDKIQKAHPGGGATSAAGAGSIHGFTIDLERPDVERALEQLLADVTGNGGGKLDHVVLTAGRPSMRGLASLDRQFILAQSQLAVVAPALVAKLAPRFLNHGFRSSITFCGGRLFARPMPGWPTAAMSAGALEGLTRALALDLAPVRVNVVHPGATETEMWGATPEQRRPRREILARSALLGKVGTPEEVAESFLYLMRDSNITGTAIDTSGGVLLQ
ncbi:putative short chain dehydrogenase reductase family [Diaporthe ampelina]|uniref:Putative short chain dehydrogenase reductase family n=1 Tax=Diaporthe ampelina TaxID=1214573 RepID=A0A0G2HB01_9PEZI|nr:putative short chain dehydrogenase reductase family [Diaporthe ampelina]